MKLNVQRLFVGNLPTDISEKDIKHRFADYGNIQSTEIKKRLDGSVFAYINLEADQTHINECLQTVPKKKWSGHNVKVELAKESFLVRLARERQEQQCTTERNSTQIGEVSPENLRKKKSTGKSTDAKSFKTTDHSPSEQITVKLESEDKDTVGNLRKKSKSRDMSTDISSSKQTRFKLETEDVISDEAMYNRKLPMFRGIANSLIECDSKTNAVLPQYSEPHKDVKLPSRADESKEVRKNENFKLEHTYNDQKYRLPVKMRFKGGNQDYQRGKTSDFQCSEVSQSINNNIPLTRSMISENKRLESIEEKRKSFKNQLQTVKKALAVVDAPINKKIVFSDNEDPTDGADNKEISTATDDKDKKVVDKTSLLFHDESSDDESDIFKIKAQFEGRKGQKLLELQSRYANDRRFTLDERFYESDESETAQELQNNNVPQDEKTRQLSILKDVLGERFHVPLMKKENLVSNSFMLRFDPLKEDHKRFEVTKQPTIGETEEDSKRSSTQEVAKKLKSESNVEGDVETPKVEVSKEKFYSVTDRLKETLKNKNKSDTQFSLLEMFGSTGHGEGESSAVEKYEHTSKNKKKQIGWQRNPFKYDSSDSEEEEQIKDLKKPEAKISESCPQKTNSESHKCFFFKENDARLKEGLEFLTSAKKMSEEEFAKRRRELKQIIRSKIKNNLRKRKPWKKKLGGQKKKFSKKK